ncbi:MAG: hypothetical protein NUV50_10110 [Rhodospirillales bacterium]|nr:hypothetical protein [Rhodospirillales bacterium]
MNTNNIAISNVAIGFPGGFKNYATQTMTVTCAITGLANGVTPNVTFPCLELPTAMTSTGNGTWSASNTDTYAAQSYSLTIAGKNVAFTVADDGSVSNIIVA